MSCPRQLHMHARDGRAGFTLIETLIATALMVAILAALATVTSQWLPNWNRGFVRVQRTELLSLGIERVVADIAAAQYVPAHYATRKPLFEGRELSVTFVRTTLDPNSPPGLEIVRFAEAADARGLALVRTQMPFAPLDPNVGVDLHRLRAKTNRDCINPVNEDSERASKGQQL